MTINDSTGSGIVNMGTDRRKIRLIKGNAKCRHLIEGNAKCRHLKN